MKAWTVETITLHRVRVPGPEVLFQRAFGETVELAIHAFVLQRDDHTVLVDTGLPADHAALDRDIRARKGADSGFVDTGASLAGRLRARGLGPDAIVLTSFGPYATGALDAWPDVPVWASARGCADLEDPEEAALVHAVAPAVHARLAGARRVDGERELLPGLTFVEVGVHHPASAALCIATAQGTLGIADPVFVTRQLLEGRALGAAEHAAGWHAMVRRLGARCDALIAIHEPDPAPLARERWHASLWPPSAS